MTSQNIYSTFIFKNKNNDQLLYQLTLRNHVNKFEFVRQAIQELTEKFSLEEIFEEVVFLRLSDLKKKNYPEAFFQQQQKKKKVFPS